MLNKKLSLLALCIAATASSTAQQMYKTVGPDGKITFSDRPEIKADTKVSVMKRNVMRPVDAPPVKEAGTRSARPQAGAAAPVVTPEIEEAILSVMGLSEFGRRFDGFCNATPVQAKAFAAANYGWKNRNVAAIEQQKQLLTVVMSPSRRAHLIDIEQQRMADEIGKAAARDPAARSEWCDGVIAELNSGRSDVDQPAMMALPIVQYRGR